MTRSRKEKITRNLRLLGKRKGLKVPSPFCIQDRTSKDFESQKRKLYTTEEKGNVTGGQNQSSGNLLSY